MRCRFSRKIKLKIMPCSNPLYLVVLATTSPLSPVSNRGNYGTAFVFDLSFRAQRNGKTLKRNLPILKKCQYLQFSLHLACHQQSSFKSFQTTKGFLTWARFGANLPFILDKAYFLINFNKPEIRIIYSFL